MLYYMDESQNNYSDGNNLMQKSTYHKIPFYVKLKKIQASL